MTTHQSTKRIPEAAVDDLFPGRWSPRSFLPDPVPPEQLESLLEAARWAPSSMNEQPWVFLTAVSETDRKRFCSLLRPGNQVWAYRAPVLMFVLARKYFRDNGRANRTALFDCGAAWMSLALQARMLGLATHAMAGIERDRAYEALGVEREQYEIIAAIAVGKQGPADALDEALRQDEVPNNRNSRETFVYQGGMPGAAVAQQISDRRDLWAREYEERQGISLGYVPDDEPPVVGYFEEVLQTHGLQAETILDAGCGKGRIGLHLLRRGHRVIGFDFVASALDVFTDSARQAGCAEALETFVQDLAQPWQVDDGSMDAVFAVTVLNNLMTTREAAHLRREVRRVLRPGGLFVLETYLPEDGYYGQLLRETGAENGGVIRDPVNGLMFRTWSPTEVHALFSDGFEPLGERTVRRKRPKYGAECERVSGVFVFQKDRAG